MKRASLKKWTLNALYFAVTALILYYIGRNVDFKQMFSILKGADVIILTAMVVLAHFQLCLAAAIYGMFLRKRGISIPVTKLSTDYFVGNFISTMPPTKYSGDLYRTYAAAQQSGKIYDSAAAALLERLSGMIVLMVMGIAAAAFAKTIAPTNLVVTLGVVFFFILMGTGLLFNEPLFHLISRLLSKLKLHSIQRMTMKFHSALLNYKEDKKFLWKMMGVSFAFKFLAFICIYMAGVAIDIPVRFISVLLVMPIIYVLDAIPISFHGIGVRETGFIFFFSKVGLLPDEAFAMSIVVLFGRLVCVATGGILFLKDRKKIGGFDRLVFLSPKSNENKRRELSERGSLKI